MDGISRLEFSVVAILFALLVGSFLQAIRHYQEQAEKLSVELTVVSMKTGLLQEIANRLVKNVGRDGQDLVGANPVGFLKGPPAAYLGEFKDVADGQIPPGSWYFDQRNGELVYKLNHARGFQARGAGAARKEIRWRVKPRESVKSGSIPVESIALLPTVDYDWL